MNNPRWRQRFFQKVNKDGPVHERLGTHCWEWVGYANENGYGLIVISGKRHYAHRVSWVLHNGAIPDGLQINHRCDNRCCVNPEHLACGTQPDNMAEMAARNRSTAGEDNPNAKLAWVKVREMRSLYESGKKTIAELARAHGISYSTAHRVVRHELWQEEGAGRKKSVPRELDMRTELTWCEVHAIRRAYAEGVGTQREIGRKWGISQAQVGRIVRRENWKEGEA